MMSTLHILRERVRCTTFAGALRRLLIAVAVTTATAPAASGSPPPQNGVFPTTPPPPLPAGGFRREAIVNTLIDLTGVDRAPPPVDRAAKGSRALPVILVYFKDDKGKFPFSADFVRDKLFGKPGAVGLQRTMTQYYEDVSNNNWHLSGQVFGPYGLSKDAAYYKDYNSAAFGELLDEALKQADADPRMNWADFDNDASTPTGSDGTVDTVLIVHSRRGGESAVAGNPNDPALQSVWSHSSQYDRPNIGHTAPFTTRSLRRDSGSTAPTQHVVVQAYTIQPALGRDVVGTPGDADFPGIGVFCHEYGHALGLPDLYDRTPVPPAQPDSLGVGDWCLMSYGMYGASRQNSGAPLPPSAWAKEVRGWAFVDTITRSRDVTFEPVEARNHIYRIDVPGSGGIEYFLLEWRDPKWKPGPNDVARENWDAELGTAGLAVWHVDRNVGRLLPNGTIINDRWPSTDAANGVEGQNDEPSTFNVSRRHSLVALVTRDGKMSFENNQWAPADGVLLSDKADAVHADPGKTPCSRGYVLDKTGIEISNIDVTARTAHVTIPAPPTPTSTPAATMAAATVPSPAPPPGGKPAGGAAAPVTTQSHALTDAAIRIEKGQELSEENLDALIKCSPWQVRLQFEPVIAEKMNAAAAEKRLLPFKPTSRPDNAADRALVAFVEQSKHAPPLVQRDPQSGRVVQIRDLQIPRADGMELYDDAESRIRQLKDVVGPSVLLARLSPTTRPVGSTAEVVSYQQLVKVGDDPVPVFGSGVKLYYEKGTVLAGVAIQTKVDPAVKLPASPPFDAQRARAIVTRALKLPEAAGQSLEECRAVVLPDVSGSKPPRAVWQVCYPTGPTQEPVHIFVDPASEKVIDVR